MCLADLEFDYINPYDFSSQINTVVLPEYIIQGFLSCFYGSTLLLGIGSCHCSVLLKQYMYISNQPDIDTTILQHGL